MAEAAVDSVPQVLVTGASGFIATHIIQQLLTGGQVKVRGTVRSLKNETKVKPLQDLVPDATYPLELVEADLLNEESWKEAVKGCTQVYHVASPVPIDGVRDENEVIIPAVNGTLNVLKAVAEAGTIKRVVLTSSTASVSSGWMGREGYVHTEADWGDETICGPYEKSKIRAEKAAWDFMEKLEDNKKFELVTILPGACFGPTLIPYAQSTLTFIEQILANKTPMLLNINFPVIDIRDVAKAHIVAMEKPESAGNRYILFSGETRWLREIAEVIDAEFGPQGYKIPLFVAPKPMTWVIKFFNLSLKQLYPLLGRVMLFSNDKLKRELGIQPHDANTTIIDSCYSLIEKGIVPKKPGYRGPQGTTDQPTAETQGVGESEPHSNDSVGQQQTEETQDNDPQPEEPKETKGEVNDDPQLVEEQQPTEETK